MSSTRSHLPPAQAVLSDQATGRAQLGEELLLAGLAVEHHLSRLLARAGRPSLLQLRVLALLALQPQIEPRQAATALNVHSASLHHTLQQLIHAGYIVQQPHPADGRRRLLRLTERGHHEYDQLREPVEHELSRLTAHLTERDQDALARLLGHLRQHLATGDEGELPEPHRYRGRAGP